MLQIDRERFLRLMNEQANIGATADGGLSRPALSEADMVVRAWFAAQAQDAGLIYRVDGAGNQSAILPAADDDAKTLLIGSHLDSVPNGGRYDGALGVVAGLEALLTLKDHEVSLPFHVEVINFTDEEGCLRGLLGSSAAAGLLDERSLENVRGGRDALLTGLARAGISTDSVLAARRDVSKLHGYIEVHVEQGTRLEDAGIDIGVVTSIVGVRSFWLTFEGEAAHAGTRPMPQRKDAMWGASAMVQRARQLVMGEYDPGVVNFGAVHAAPGAFNIVPATVRLALEFRHGEAARLDAMEDALLKLARDVAGEFDLNLHVEAVDRIAPAPMDEGMMQRVEAAVQRCSLKSTRLMSFAGHDAQCMAQVTPSVMYFVPSVGGISHNPAEYTSDDDCINAANVMLHAILGGTNG